MGSGDNGKRVCRKSDIVVVAVADIASWKDIKLAAATVKVSESTHWYFTIIAKELFLIWC